MDKVTLEVRTGIGTVREGPRFRSGVVPNFTDHVEWITRIPRQHSGWQSVGYKGKRYRLGGGIRTTHFICLNNPVQGKS